MKNIEPFKVSPALSELLVRMEEQLKKNPNIFLKDVVAGLPFGSEHCFIVTDF